MLRSADAQSSQAEGESKYDDLEKRLAEAPVINVPIISLEGDANGVPHPDATSYAKKFLRQNGRRLKDLPGTD